MTVPPEARIAATDPFHAALVAFQTDSLSRSASWKRETYSSE